MKILLAVVVVAPIVALGACTTVGNSPATAPPITASPVTEPTAAVSTTVTPATALETTTTVDRVTEIQAIFQDLERLRLQAIMDKDEEAFRAVFANAEYEERSMGGMELVTVIDPTAAVFTVLQVFVDDPTCVAVEAVADGTLAIRGADIGQPTDYVIEQADFGWGFSWAGSGWRCDGPHPFSD